MPALNVRNKTCCDASSPVVNLNPAMCAQACCTLQPAFPDLPDEHSETIEANIVNQNFTFVARHMFSRSYGVVCTGSRAQPWV